MDVPEKGTVLSGVLFVLDRNDRDNAVLQASLTDMDRPGTLGDQPRPGWIGLS
jgi:hypothetical protein